MIRVVLMRASSSSNALSGYVDVVFAAVNL
jgi:hypothetical protein